MFRIKVVIIYAIQLFCINKGVMFSSAQLSKRHTGHFQPLYNLIVDKVRSLNFE